MKLKKKTRKYRARRVSKEDVLAALARRQIEVIYSWGAFCLHGLGCRIGDVAFRFDFEVNPMYSAARYLMEHSELEVAEKICRELNGHGRLKKKDRKYCLEFLSSCP